MLNLAKSYGSIIMSISFVGYSWIGTYGYIVYDFFVNQYSCPTIYGSVLMTNPFLFQ